MKVLFPSQDASMDSKMSPVFGRCPYFMVVEIENGSIVGSTPVPNEAVSQQGGAGIAAAQAAHELGVSIIVAGTVGPKAFDALKSLGIEVYESVSGTVQDNADAFLQGQLPKASPDSHAGLFKK